MSARVVRNIRDIVDRYRAMMGTLNGNAASVLATEGAALEGEFIREILKRSGKLTPKQVEEVRAIFRDLVAKSSRDVAARMSKYVGPTMRTTAARTMATTTELLAAVNHPQARDVLLTMREWTQRIDQRSLIRTPFYRARWEKAWSGNWDRMVNRTMDDLTEAALRREPWDVVSKRLLDLGKLNEAPGALTPAGNLARGTIAGHMHPEAFARGFARTALGDLSQDESIAEGHEIGLLYYGNFGVPDDRQSEICAAASAEEPKTVEEWKRWRRDVADPSNDGGPPKRHVFNCRCDLIGIPKAALALSWGQTNLEANTYRTKYAGAFERKAA